MSQSYLMRPSLEAEPPMISHGIGAKLFDESGRDYIDGSSGAIVANIGHGIGEIADVAAAQLRRVAYTYRTQFRNAPAEALAEKLVRLSADKAKAFFLSSGSEATEAALRLILQYWEEVGKPGKRRILSRRVSYHGNTLGALSISADARRQAISGWTIEEPLVGACYCYRCPVGRTPDGCEADCARLLEDAIQQVGAANVAAFVTEPIIGATGGAIVPHDNYFSRIREICDRHDILLVVDEVITGLGRTGRWFAMHHWGVPSDLTILGKGLNAGYTPLSALLIGERIVGAIERGSRRISIGHTHSGNPGSAAICNAVVDYIDAHGLVAAAATKGERLGAALRAQQQRHRFIGEVRGLGLLWGIEFVADRGSRTPFARTVRLTDRLVDTVLGNGLVVYPCRGLVNSSQGDAILLSPPLTITPAELDELIERLDRSLSQVAAGL